jgi:NTP pyrophosphatase (non-canonical NTP hydrolase)
MADTLYKIFTGMNIPPTFEDYQELAMRTASQKEHMTELMVSVMGLATEAGEAVDTIKKHVEQGHDLNVDNLIEEAGDVLWYVARLCRALDVDMGAVAVRNIEKLKRRYPDGFSTEASVNRVV